MPQRTMTIAAAALGSGAAAGALDWYFALPRPEREEIDRRAVEASQRAYGKGLAECSRAEFWRVVETVRPRRPEG